MPLSWYQIITEVKTGRNKTHSRNTEADITFSANNDKFKHTLLPNMHPSSSSPSRHTCRYTHTHSHWKNNNKKKQICTTHTAPSPSYPPLPSTQSLKAALSSCCHASVAERWGWGLAIVRARAGSQPATPQLPALLYGRQRSWKHHLSSLVWAASPQQRSGWQMPLLWILMRLLAGLCWRKWGQGCTLYTRARASLQEGYSRGKQSKGNQLSVSTAFGESSNLRQHILK